MVSTARKMMPSRKEEEKGDGEKWGERERERAKSNFWFVERTWRTSGSKLRTVKGSDLINFGDEHNMAQSHNRAPSEIKQQIIDMFST